MSLINDFNPFATAGGADVVDQATWNSLPARSTGFVTGTAESNQANKAFRQGIWGTATIFQFIQNILGINVNDDGNLAAAVLNLTNAIKGVAVNTGTNSVIAANQALGAPQNGNSYFCAAPLTLTTASSAVLGATWKTWAFSAGGLLTFTPDPADKINGGTAGASFTVAQGFLVSITSDGDGNILVESDANQTTALIAAAQAAAMAAILPLTETCVPTTGNHAVLVAEDRSIFTAQSVGLQTYTLPLSSTVDAHWSVVVWAELGSVVLNPTGGDQINGIGGGGLILVPRGSVAIISTDGAGHFFAAGDWDLPKNRKVISVPNLTDAAGTITAESWELLPGGRIRKTCVMQLLDDNGGHAGETWTFTTTPLGSGRYAGITPPAFSSVTGIKLTNIAGLQAATPNSPHAATTAAVWGESTGQVTLVARNSGFSGTLTGFYIEVEGV